MECVTQWDLEFAKEDIKPLKRQTIYGEEETHNSMFAQTEVMWLDKKERFAGTSKFADVIHTVAVDMDTGFEDNVEFTELLVSETLRYVLPEMGTDWNMNHKSGLSSRQPFSKHTLMKTEEHIKWFNELHISVSKMTNDLSRISGGHQTDWHKCPLCDGDCRFKSVPLRIVDYDSLDDDLKTVLKNTHQHSLKRTSKTNQRMSLDHLVPCPVCEQNVSKHLITGKYKPRCNKCWREFFKDRDKCRCGQLKNKRYPLCYRCYRR